MKEGTPTRGEEMKLSDHLRFYWLNGRLYDSKYDLFIDEPFYKAEVFPFDGGIVVHTCIGGPRERATIFERTKLEDCHEYVCSVTVDGRFYGQTGTYRIGGGR
jgi:hypothetical protein